ncbi:MAG: hypothetical protein BMS9Abin36_1080 [Gammaproteobacteria bacterium]|nr:MAG: hypothetical protein BMS9Abin36_1080 [Gammaproteobacteria bacterium]
MSSRDGTSLKHRAGEYLGGVGEYLGLGYWGLGNSTRVHVHDDNNEILSGVVYLKVAPESGDLLLHDLASVTTVASKVGRAPGHPAASTAAVSHHLSLSPVSGAEFQHKSALICHVPLSNVAGPALRV